MSDHLVNVVDVYELATEMGKEIEHIMDMYGADAVTRLMPKVINALELLESFAIHGDEENSQLDDLRTKVAQLETEKVGKAEDRLKFEKELEQMEEHLQGENRDLIALVTRLQMENRKLCNSLAEKDDGIPNIECSGDQDVLILHKLNAVLSKQRDQLRAKERELQQKTCELETSQSQLDRLVNVNKELYRKKRNGQLQTRALIEEKAELQAQLQDQQRELVSLRDKLGATRKTNQDLLRMKSPTMPNLSGKVMYDVDDPDRPRFTMNELRKVLFERNELKAKVNVLSDELEMYRPKTISHSPYACDDDDAPVQGPINREPDDAPWKKVKDSGIRKLFRVLFGDSAESSKQSSPRSHLARFTSNLESRSVFH